MPECPGKGFSGFPQSRGPLLGGLACEGPRALRREREAGPTGPRPLSPSPLVSLGRSCSPAAFPVPEVGRASCGKGLSGPQPPAPPRSPVELSIFKHTYTYTNLHGGFVTRVHPGSATRHSQVGTAKKKKKKKKKSIKWPLHCHGALVVFLFALSLLRLPGCPCPWGPRDSGLWFGKLADEVFVCLFVTERREVGGRSSGKRSSITCSG